MVKRLEDKVRKLEAQRSDSVSEIEIQKHIAESMYKEDVERKKKEAELEGSQNSDLNNLIVNDESSQEDAGMDGEGSIKGSVKAKSEHKAAAPLISENTNT